MTQRFVASSQRSQLWSSCCTHQTPSRRTGSLGTAGPSWDYKRWRGPCQNPARQASHGNYRGCAKSDEDKSRNPKAQAITTAIRTISIREICRSSTIKSQFARARHAANVLAASLCFESMRPLVVLSSTSNAKGRRRLRPAFGKGVLISKGLCPESPSVYRARRNTRGHRLSEVSALVALLDLRGFQDGRMCRKGRSLCEQKKYRAEAG